MITKSSYLLSTLTIGLIYWKMEIQKIRGDRWFKKAYKAALKAFICASSSNNKSDASASPQATVADTGNDSDESALVGSLAAHAPRMFASLNN